MKRKIITEESEGPDAKIQVIHLETMAEDEFTNVTEGMDEIHSSNNDQETSCEAKVFTMHFSGLLQSAVDSASDSENSTQGQNGNGSNNTEKSRTGQNQQQEDVEEDLNEEGIELWLRKFKNDDVLKKLITKLYEAKLLKDFWTLIEVISTGQLEHENLPLILCLERAKYCKCTTTTLMRFHEKLKAFWTMGYRTWHGKGLLLMSGSKNHGQVCDNITKLGYYKPDMSSMNFVVPDVKTLFNEKYGFPKEINPTNCIQEAFDLLDKTKDHILLYDFKKVVRGLKGPKMGDKDMWSFEGPPTLQETYSRLQEELHILFQIKEVCEENNFQLLAYHTSRLLNCLSVRIKEMRTLETYYRRQLVKYDKDPKTSDLKKSCAISQIYLTKACTKQTVNVKRDLCSILSKMNNMDEEYQDTGYVDLNIQSNMDILFPPEILKKYCNLSECPELVKQITEEWYNLCKESRVTGSTCFKAVGFGLLREQQEHFDTFILKRDPKPVSEEVKCRMEHGKLNEINGVSTICAILMPSCMHAACGRWLFIYRW